MKRYDHFWILTEIEKVEKYISEAMSWLNSKMNAQNKLSLTQDPVVKREVSEIVAKSKVRNCKLPVYISVQSLKFLIATVIQHEKQK